MSVFTARWRGFRVLEILALTLLLGLVVAVYLSKTGAGNERSLIAQTETEIAAERERIRALQAEVAHLEAPERLERLAVQHLAMAPTPADRETTIDQLPQVALGETPARPGTPR